MTSAAWIMLGATWSVIIFFTARFFWLVVRIPLQEQPPAGEEPEPPASAQRPG